MCSKSRRAIEKRNTVIEMRAYQGIIETTE